MNRRNRTLSFLVAGSAFVVHMYDLGILSPGWMLLIGLQFLVWPHLLYSLSRSAEDPAVAESRNTIFDAVAFGFWSAAAGVTPWIIFMCLTGATINPCVFRGKKGLFQGLAGYVVGLLLALLFVDVTFAKHASMPVVVIVSLTLLYFLNSVALGIYDRALRLHKVTAQLKESEESLKLQLDNVDKLRRELKEQSLRDPMTNLYNRRYFDPALDRDIASARRSGLPLCLALIDIDHFKSINDEYGHPTGDSVILALAQMLQEATRKSDIAARLGVEEFALILGDTPLAEAVYKLEQLRAAWADKHVIVGSTSIKSTFSVGLVLLTLDDKDRVDMLKRADSLLYEAKRNGRNQVVAR